eukprot:CAMPEP_0169289500 /NCGR_PEP_ID=MMETSP1016-20121227/61180_1 /TAXON_ID=342587 /ORGANISM="Karlodinium micrum, Strain CCMP2283" /LENGTH=80 /DNA_ID=CAMNT_0009379909 /DNA_START=700 /DNA_END=945 /DNA_ORIENTATION=+
MTHTFAGVSGGGDLKTNSSAWHGYPAAGHILSSSITAEAKIDASSSEISPASSTKLELCFRASCRVEIPLSVKRPTRCWS